MPEMPQPVPDSARRGKIFTKIAVPVFLVMFFAVWLAVFFNVLYPVYYQIVALLIWLILVIVGLKHIFIKGGRLFALALLGAALGGLFWGDLIYPTKISDSLRTFHITSLNAKEARLTGRGYIHHNLAQWEGPGSQFYVTFDKESKELLIKSGLAEESGWSDYDYYADLFNIDASIRPTKLRKQQISGIFNFKYDPCAVYHNIPSCPTGPALLITDIH